MRLTLPIGCIEPSMQPARSITPTSRQELAELKVGTPLGA